MKDNLFNFATIEKMQNAPRASWQKDEDGVIPLWLADPDFHAPPEIKEALIKAVKDENLYYNFFDRTAEEAMAEKIKRKNGIEAKVDDIILTPGIQAGMWLAVKHACKPGDEVVITDPMYFPFIEMANEIQNTKAINWKINIEEDYHFDIEALKDLITPQTKLLFVCNPHNPAGRVMTKEELKGIADLAVDNEIVVMSDELWEDIIFDGREHISIASLNPEIESLTLSQFGFSKAYCVAGLKIGYLCATNEEIRDNVRKIARQTRYGCTNLAKAVSPVMLDDTLDWWRQDVMEYLHNARAYTEKRLDEIPKITYPKLEGTYLMFPKFDYSKSSEELEKYLFEKAKVRLSIGTQFGPQGEGHLRMSIATSEVILSEALDRIEKALDELL
jgi:aspartate/methionine/tyrosine aminotransferase